MESLFLIQLVLYLFGAFSPFVLRNDKEALSRWVHLFAIAAGVSGIVNSLLILMTAKTVFLQTFGIPFVGPLCFSIDRLSAFFVFVISFISIPCSLFAIGYVKEFQDTKRISFLGFFYNLFLLAMLLVVCVSNAFYFLMFWEMMSLTSFFLVIFEHEKPQARRAGLVYFVMTHIATAFIAACFWLLFSHTGSFLFHDFVLQASSVPSGLKNAIFVMALIGFGTKAGIIPLHIWLPEAHPQAPSHVSALMSSVMIKTAIYALIRFLFSFLGPVPLWWAGAVLLIAIISTIMGVLYALMEHDLKRLLAFHSIENIGIILLGMGMALVFVSVGKPLFASFALIATLFHVLNHATFKGLLFLGAGSVLSKTHTRNIEELGGLIKKMPTTAACFLVGSVAISALPPFNGFVSEWMTFISLLSGSLCKGVTLQFFSLILASLLGLAGALAATCFVKAFGITFLGQARSTHATSAQEVGLSMRLAMGLLGASCLGFALSAPWIVSLLQKVAGGLIAMGSENHPLTWKGLFIFLSPMSQVSPMVVAVILFIFVSTIGFFFLFNNKDVGIVPSWGCGFPEVTGRMQYTATGFSKPLRRIFSFLYQPTRRVELEERGPAVLRTAQHFESGIIHVIDEGIYRPLIKFMRVISRKAKWIQTGHIQLYLSYIFVTLILLLIFWGR